MAKMEQITTKTKIAGYEKEVAQLEQLKVCASFDKLMRFHSHH